MKAVIFVIFALISSATAAQPKVDSVTFYLRELIPNKLVTRTSALDEAAEIHAKYLIANKKACHLQLENPNHYSARNRAEAAGDTGGYGGYSEVLWAGEPYLSESVKESIYYFKGSPMHWSIITKSTQVSANVKFGYCRITTPEWDVCVIVFGSYL